MNNVTFPRVYKDKNSPNWYVDARKCGLDKGRFPLDVTILKDGSKEAMLLNKLEAQVKAKATIEEMWRAQNDPSLVELLGRLSQGLKEGERPTFKSMMNRTFKGLVLTSVVDTNYKAKHGPKRKKIKKVNATKAVKSLPANIKLCDLTTDMLEGLFRAWKNDGLSDATIENYLGFIQRVHNKAKNRRWNVPFNSDLVFRPVSNHTVLSHHFESHELDVLMPALEEGIYKQKTNEHSVRWRKDQFDFFKFMLATGARKYEAINLSWSRVDLNEKAVQIRPNEWLPLTPKALEVLSRRHESSGHCAYVFPAAKGGVSTKGYDLLKPRKDWSLNFISETIKELGLNSMDRCKQGLELTPAQSARDTFAKQAVASDVSLDGLQTILGVADRNRVMKYADADAGKAMQPLLMHMNALTHKEETESLTT